MSCLQVYCLFHFKDKGFANIIKVGLFLDKDFAPNEYHVDEKHYPKSATKFATRKKKAFFKSIEPEPEAKALEEDERRTKKMLAMISSRVLRQAVLLTSTPRTTTLKKEANPLLLEHI